MIIATTDDAYAQKLKQIGATIYPINYVRGGLSLFNDFRTLFSIFFLLREHRPVLIHNFNAKPMIFNSLMAKISRSRVTIVNTVTGVGMAFYNSRLIKFLGSLGYRFLKSSSHSIIFQNHDDFDFFIKNGWAHKEQATVILGSGVDTDLFQPSSHTSSGPNIKVLLVTRLLKHKGVEDFIAAATEIQKSHKNVHFLLGGEFDAKHPDSIPQSLIDSAVNSGAIQYLGYVDNFNEVLQDTDIFLFPSFYREGLPRVILEAASSGIPVVAADNVGTREAVRHGKTGFLFEPRNIQQMCEYIVLLAEDSKLRETIGQSARQLAVDAFDIRDITKQQLDVYKRLGLDIVYE